ncbi:MAG: hypothetical protein HY048_02690 [Acidobacteria bacterium]|nr:hypothetical protein [Acidobacteriota bacterium]
MKRFRIAFALVAAAFLPSLAHAQSPWLDKAWVTIDGGFQPSASSFSAASTFRINAEAGALNVSYPVTRATQLDFGGGARVWRNLGVGVAVSFMTQSDAAGISGNVPHPFFFNQPRSLSGQSAALNRQETGIHVLALWMIPVRENVQVGVFGGPTYFMVKQGIVNTVSYSESYPYDSVSFTTADTADQSKNKMGFNVGVDGTYLLSKSVGVGATLRFSRATVNFDAPDGTAIASDVGGVQAGAGLRLRF